MIRYSATDQDMDEVAAVTGVVVSDGHWGRHSGRNGERPDVEHVCRILFGLPSKVDDRLFALSKRPRVCRRGRVKRPRTFLLDMTSVAKKEMNQRSKSSFGSGMSRALQILCMRVC